MAEMANSTPESFLAGSPGDEGGGGSPGGGGDASIGGGGDDKDGSKDPAAKLQHFSVWDEEE